MSLLHEIQAAVAQEDTNLSSIFLKLRVLAARLGSEPLGEWIKYESEGYPREVDVPSYRVTQATYTGTFLGPFNSGIRNAPIPPFLVEKYAGKQWTNYEIRQGIAQIDKLIEQSEDETGMFTINSSDLILLLDGKIYEQFSCNGIEGSIPSTSLVQIQHAVRMRILDFTLKLEKSVPSSTDISFASSRLSEESDSAKATQIYQSTIYGNPTFISGVEGSQFSISIGERDVSALRKCLVDAGIPSPNASALAEIMASEEPNSKEDPFGEKAKSWLADNLGRAVDGTKGLAKSVAVNVLTEVALKFYGLK